MDDKLPEKDNPSAVTRDSIKADASQKKRERSWRWLWQLVLAFVLGLLIHWLWPLARQRYPKLPEMSPEEVLAILAIAFAVVQFLDARGQEHELNAISGELRAETTNLKGQIGDLRIETANLGGQIGKLQTETTNLGTQIGDIITQANQLHTELQGVTDTLGSEIKRITQQANLLHTELTGIAGNLAQQTSGLKDISGSISTRFVGAFPENMREIIEILRTARETIEIIVDFPGYGQYSALQYHKDYIEALKNARKNNVKIQIICYQLSLVREERLEQFPDLSPEEWLIKTSEKKFQNYFAEFNDIPQPANRAGLREALTARDHRLIDELRHSQLTWKFHPDRATFFLWRIDNVEAVFTFKNVGRTDVGLSFRTHDGNLVKQFGNIFERRWMNAKDEYDSSNLQS